MSYCGKPFKLSMQKDKDNDLSIGSVLLTQAGMELAAISNAPGIEGFVDYIKEKWRAHMPNTENS